MKNRYFVLRHGQSKANVSQLIVSHPDEGVKPEYGLTDIGKQQAEESMKQKISEGVFTPSDSMVIISSPFSRARQTTHIALETLRKNNVTVDDPVIDDRLRERFFDELDLEPSDRYHIVWEKDPHDPDHMLHGAESVHDVLERAVSLIEELEDAYENKKIILSSHGDPLDILLAVSAGIHPGEHKQSIEPTKNADCRELENMERILQYFKSMKAQSS